MAGRQLLLTASLLFSGWASQTLAQNPESPAPGAAATQRPWVRKQGQPGPGVVPGAKVESPEFDNVRKAIEALTPEQRRQFQANFARWTALSPEEKRVLREREELRRKRITEEVDRAMAAAGLQLDDARKAQFAKRYAEERRKVEEQVRREMEEKRRPLVQGIVAKLKAEFSSPADAQPDQTSPAPVSAEHP